MSGWTAHRKLIELLPYMYEIHSYRFLSIDRKRQAVSLALFAGFSERFAGKSERTTAELFRNCLQMLKKVVIGRKKNAVCPML